MCKRMTVHYILKVKLWEIPEKLTGMKYFVTVVIVFGNNSISFK